MGGRRGGVKPRNTNRGITGIDNTGGLTVGVVGSGENREEGAVGEKAGQL